MFAQIVSVALKGTLLLFVIAQFASTTKGTGDGGGLAEVRTFLNEVQNGKKEDFKRRMQADFAFKDKNAKKENPHYKITKEARQVQVGLMASLLPEPAEEKGIEFRQLEEGIKAMFKKGLFDKTLSKLFLHRIDQLAQRPHMGEELAEKLFEADAANEEKRRLRSNVLDVVTKFRLFFYRWLAGLIDHLDYGGNKRAKFYRNELTVNELERGQAFQLYLADWLQNGVLKALGERIFRDLINNQKQNICWEAMVPFCVHTSLRVFLNYDELLILDHHFRLMIIEPDVDAFKVVRDFLHYVTQKLAGQRKTVKWIRDQIFTNLPLLDDPLKKQRLEQTLSIAAAEGNAAELGEAETTTTIKGDAHQQVLFQFFVRFYRELAKLASPKWLQTLIDISEAAKTEVSPARGILKEILNGILKPLKGLRIFSSASPMDMGKEKPSATSSSSLETSENDEKRKTEAAHGHATAVKQHKDQGHHKTDDELVKNAGMTEEDMQNNQRQKSGQQEQRHSKNPEKTQSVNELRRRPGKGPIVLSEHQQSAMNDY